MNNTLNKYERLKKEQHIQTLFLTGKAFAVFPIKFIHLIIPRPLETFVSPVQVGFSVPKKKFKRSVDRHRIRRLMFEAWRLNKTLIYYKIPENLQMHLFLIYVGTTLPEFETIKLAMVKGITILQEKA